jgi:hypothetical protein
MIGKLLQLSAIALALLTGSPTAATATTPSNVTITSAITVGPFTGTWSAAGGISDSGTLAEPSVNFVGNGQLHIVRDVTGSAGTFTLRIDSTLTNTEPDGTVDFNGHWAVISGTGAYSTLHGEGTRTARLGGTGIVIETLSGTVHND